MDAIERRILGRLFPMNYPPLLAVALGDSPGLLEAVLYQLIGLIVVFTALGAIWLLMELMGVAFRAVERRRVQRAVATVAPVPAVGSIAVPLIDPEIAPELVAVLTAAAHDSLRAGEQIVSIMPAGAEPELTAQQLAWSGEGRRQIFASHKVR